MKHFSRILGLAALLAATGVHAQQQFSLAFPQTTITSPNNNQCLVYQSSSKTWVNGSCASGGGVTVTGSPVNGNLTFFSGTGTISSGNLSGDCSTSGTGVLACTKVNGNTPGGACTNQAVTSLSSSAVPTCTTLTSAYVDTSIAKTGTDVNTSNQVTATHLASALSVDQGGTGQPTITLGDLLYGSASNVLSKLAGNTTATKQFLTQTGTGTVSAAPAWGAIAATDIQGLTPVWTGNQEISDAEPRYILTNTGQGTDLKKWDLDLNAGVLCFRTRTDADAAGQNVLCTTRGTTTALTNETFGYSVAGTYTFPFTGTATFSGPVSATDSSFSSVALTGTNIPTVGLSKSAGGSILFNTAGITRGAFSSATGGIFSTNGGILSAGTKFTAAGTGCTVGTTAGGATAGTFTLAAGPCTSVAITMNGATGTTATNGWTCQAHDRTAPLILIGGESSSTTTTATITIPATAGSTDVISFSCTGF
jgi:hypothetical protein